MNSDYKINISDWPLSYFLANDAAYAINPRMNNGEKDQTLLPQRYQRIPQWQILNTNRNWEKNIDDTLGVQMRETVNPITHVRSNNVFLYPKNTLINFRPRS